MQLEHNWCYMFPFANACHQREEILYNNGLPWHSRELITATGSSTDLLIMDIISGRSWSTYLFKSQVAIRSKLNDLFRELMAISLTSASQVGQSILCIFPLNIMDQGLFVDILHVLFAELEMVFFLMIVVFLIKKLLNLSISSSAEVKDWRFTFEFINFLVNFLVFSTFFYLCEKEALLLD